MSVLTHLQNTVSLIKIADWEKTSIDASIRSLSNKLSSHFNSIESKFVFGSYNRNTILRRSKDPYSDVDYMVVFSDGSSFQPQTLMTRLRTFANTYYPSNDIKQSTPTIVIQMSSIYLELAPAYQQWGTYYIPAPFSSYANWISTNPNNLKKEVDTKHRNNGYVIKDLIQILKYWNAKNNKVFSSYDIEQYIVNRNFFWCTNLKDYFYSAVEGMGTYNLSILNTAKVNSLKQKVINAKQYELDGYPVSAEYEIKKAI